MSDTRPLVVQRVDADPHGTDGRTVFTFIGAGGQQVSVELSPSSQMHLVAAILAGARGRVVDGQFQLSRPPIRVHGFQPFVMPDDTSGLELQIHETAALHVMFGGRACDQLAESLHTLRMPD